MKTVASPTFVVLSWPLYPLITFQSVDSFHDIETVKALS